jgi:hypothetical protein
MSDEDKQKLGNGKKRRGRGMGIWAEGDGQKRGQNRAEKLYKTGWDVDNYTGAHRRGIEYKKDRGKQEYKRNLQYKRETKRLLKSWKIAEPTAIGSLPTQPAKAVRQPSEYAFANASEKWLVTYNTTTRLPAGPNFQSTSKHSHNLRCSGSSALQQTAESAPGSNDQPLKLKSPRPQPSVYNTETSFYIASSGLGSSSEMTESFLNTAPTILSTVNAPSRTTAPQVSIETGLLPNNSVSISMENVNTQTPLASSRISFVQQQMVCIMHYVC